MDEFNSNRSLEVQQTVSVEFEFQFHMDDGFRLSPGETHDILFKSTIYRAIFSPYLRSWGERRSTCDQKGKDS